VLSGFFRQRSALIRRFRLRHHSKTRPAPEPASRIHLDESVEIRRIIVPFSGSTSIFPLRVCLVLKTSRRNNMKTLLFTFAWVLCACTALSQEMASPKPRLSCGKDHTTSENLLAASQDSELKGTVGLIVVTKLELEKMHVSTRVFYSPDVTYKEAATLGDRVDAFFWVPNRAMSFQDLVAGKQGKTLTSCCASGGCSKCCNSGACVCYTTETGNCFCSGC
jgi:hypothetical protein